MRLTVIYWGGARTHAPTHAWPLGADVLMAGGADVFHTEPPWDVGHGVYSHVYQHECRHVCRPVHGRVYGHVSRHMYMYMRRHVHRHVDRHLYMSTKKNE